MWQLDSEATKASSGSTAAASDIGSGTTCGDEEAGISYRAYGPPWVPWDEVWRAGTLEVPYRIGQHFVTETYSGGQYHASILSAAVPAADNDAVTLNLECVGRQVAADVRAEYYPQPNTMDPLRDEVTRLGGRPAWVSEFRLHFAAPGLTAMERLTSGSDGEVRALRQPASEATGGGSVSIGSFCSCNSFARGE